MDQHEGSTATEDGTATSDEFLAGFDGTATQGDKPAPADAPEGERKEPAATDAAPQEQQQPEYVQVTRQDWEDLRARAAEIDKIRDSHGAQLSSVHGKIGAILQKLDAVKASTGGVTDEDLAELEREYPDLAGLAVFKKLKGGGGSAADADPEEFGRRVQERVDPLIQQARADARLEAERVFERRLLSREYPDWREVIGLTADDKPVQTPYREWLAQQPADYQQTVGSSWDADVIGESVKRFKQAQKAAAQAAGAVDARQRRLAAAVPARGDAAVSHSSDGDDEFVKGFNEGRS